MPPAPFFDLRNSPLPHQIRDHVWTKPAKHQPVKLSKLAAPGFESLKTINANSNLHAFHSQFTSNICILPLARAKVRILQDKKSS